MNEDHKKKHGGLEGSKDDVRTVAGFGALYDEYATKIWTHIFVRIRLRDQSNDLVSQVFFKTWEYVKKGNSIANAKSFLYRSADNAIIDWYRSNKNTASIERDFEDTGAEPSYHERFEEKNNAKDDTQKLYAALAHLSEKERSLLLMRFTEELEIKEIALLLGKTIGAVNVALHRAMKNLHAQL